MTEATEQPEAMLTEDMLLDLDRDIEVADAHIRRWAPVKERSVLIRRYLTPHVGRPLAEVLADARVALEQAEADVVAAQAAVDASRERLRDYEGYIRVLRERHPELADSEIEPAITRGGAG